MRISYSADESHGQKSEEIMTKPTPVTYAQSGVDIDRGDAFVDKIAPLAKSTRRTGSMDAIGGFGGLFDLKALDMKDPVLVAGTDGIGSKLDWAEAMERFDTIGIDLVAMCVNDLLCQNAQPLFFLDYFAVHKLDPEQGAELIKGVVEGCLQSDCQLIGGETAEMPTLYPAGKFDLAGFAVGAVERDEILPKPVMKAGQKLVGVASSGLHSNGYSLIQRVLKEAGLGAHDTLPGTEALIGDLLLDPTKIYVRPGKRAAHLVSGYAHITGGGLVGNLKRVLPKGTGFTVDLSEVPAPLLADWAIRSGWVEAEEAQRVWNMGIGLVAVLAEGVSVADFQAAFGEEAVYELGQLTEDGEYQLRDKKYGLS